MALTAVLAASIVVGALAGVAAAYVTLSLLDDHTI